MCSMADLSASSRPAATLPPGHPDPVPALAALPPPALPLGFLAAAAPGLAACGGALIWARGVAATDPTADPVVVAVHLAVLATLTTGVLGALHQFIPLLTHRPLLSHRLAWATLGCWVPAAWLLPLGVATESPPTVEAGGALATLAVALSCTNLLPPLRLSGGGPSLVGLRVALCGFGATVAYGAVYVADRRTGWFHLSGQLVLAHAVVGLFAWLGLTYLAVAERLWPMFLMARAPTGRRAPWLAIGAVPAGIALLSPGLLVGLPALAWPGAALLGLGLSAHLASLLHHLRHRRGTAGVEVAFVVTSAAWVPVAAGLGLAATLVIGRAHHAGVALSAAAVAAACAWLLQVLVGLSQKVGAFMVWPLLRGRTTLRGPDGRHLQFSDLYDRRLAWLSYAALTCGFGSLCVGLAGSSQPLIGLAGVLLIATALLTATNLTATTVRRLAASRRTGGPPGPVPEGRAASGSGRASPSTKGSRRRPQ